MPLFDPAAILNNSDLVGPQKLFGSQPALDDAVLKHGFPPRPHGRRYAQAYWRGSQ